MTSYRERLWPALWLYVSTALVIPASLLVFLPINQTVGVIVAIALYAGCVVLLIVGSPTLRVTADAVFAGRARIPLENTGELAAFDGEEATLERGQRLDSRAWLLIRGWIRPVARITVVDDRDPTPYWLVSTRQPKAFIDAIAAARAARATSPS